MTGMSRAERRAAREKMRRAALATADPGQRGQHPASRAALDRHRAEAIEAQRHAPRCKATARRSGTPCRQPAVRGADFCAYHGGREQAPTSQASRRWYRKHGARLEQISRTKNALRQQLKGMTQEERETIGEALPRRVAGGPLPFLQLLVMGMNALRASRDGSDPLAWHRFTRHAASCAFIPKRDRESR